jgi:hypothetical protein
MDKLPGGKGDNKKPSDFDKKELAEGQSHEREHTTDKSLSKEIAMDHLTEDPKYYSRLKNFEKAAFAGMCDELQKIAFNASYYSAPLSYGPFPQASQSSGKAPTPLKVKPADEKTAGSIAGMKPPALYNNPIKKTVTIASIVKPMGKGTGTALPGAGNPARPLEPPKVGGN